MKLLEVYRDKLFGSIKGLDRIRFRGTNRSLMNLQGLSAYLYRGGILLKDFGRWAEGLTKRLRADCARRALQLGIPTIYLDRGGVDKEQYARQIAARDRRHDGSICMFSVIEPCVSPTVRPSRQDKTRELCMRHRKCIWVYHYFDDPRVGFGHLRLQTWLPFTAQVCLNGRHWLEKQLLAEHVAYIKDRNCFPYIADIAAAQRLLDQQLCTDWVELLDGLLEATCPAMAEILHPHRPRYYWSADETEYATDLMFRSSGELAATYPSLIRHATIIANSPSVLRFLGCRNRLTRGGAITGRVARELSTDYRRRSEGLRVKHRHGRNSCKMYDKGGNILRLETTINDTRAFKSLRPPPGDPASPPTWQPLRKGVSDLYHRCQISDRCNHRYGNAIAAAHVADTLKQVAGDLCSPVRRRRRRHRALNPWRSDDYQLLTFLADGRWAINGFRNRDLREFLHPEQPSDARLARRLSGRATRCIGLLRAHGLIRKAPRQNRYLVTARGQTFCTAIIAAAHADTKQLIEMAA